MAKNNSFKERLKKARGKKEDDRLIQGKRLDDMEGGGRMLYLSLLNQVYNDMEQIKREMVKDTKAKYSEIAETSASTEITTLFARVKKNLEEAMFIRLRDFYPYDPSSGFTEDEARYQATLKTHDASDLVVTYKELVSKIYKRDELSIDYNGIRQNVNGRCKGLVYELQKYIGYYIDVENETVKFAWFRQYTSHMSIEELKAFYAEAKEKNLMSYGLKVFFVTLYGERLKQTKEYADVELTPNEMLQMLGDVPVGESIIHSKPFNDVVRELADGTKQKPVSGLRKISDAVLDKAAEIIS